MKQFLPFLFAAVAGFFCLGYEIASAKMTEPFYGAGIESWSAVLGSIMAGFAGGYLLGHWAAGRHAPARWVFRLTWMASVWVGLLVVAGDGWMGLLHQGMGESSQVLVQVLLSFPPILLMSATSPLLIQIRSSAGAAPGSSTGGLMAVSTLGGVAGLFCTGFWVIPSLGVGLWLVVNGLLLSALALAWQLVMSPKEWKPLAFPALAVAGLSIWMLVGSDRLPSHVVYRNTGLHGELMVTDLPLEPEYGGTPRRMILNNRIAQTAVHPQGNFSLWDYPHYLSSVAGMKPTGSKALLLGMAGGTVAVELTQLGYQVEAVDLDPRMQTVAQRYFDLPAGVKVTIDDARHHLNTTPVRHDLVVMDLFSAEGQPAHVFSQESFTQVRQVLKPDGMLIVNYHGFLDGEEGRGTRSVLKTLQAAGFHTYMVATPGTPVQRNLLLIGMLAPMPDPNQISFRQNQCCNVRLGYIGNMIHTLDGSICADGILLRDDLPALDRLNRHAYRQWREYAIAHYLLPLHDGGLPYY